MSLRRAGSCRHGPRPVSSRRSSGSSMYTIEENDRRSSSSSSRFTDLSWSTPTTPSYLQTSFRLSTCTSSDEDSVISRAHEADLQRRPHIRRARRNKAKRPRPLPALPSNINRPPLSINIPLSPDPTQNYRPRWLPVPPLPMSAFPTIPPTACSTPATTLPPPVEYPRFEDEIDWSVIDEILASHN